MLQEVLLATGNQGKVRELQALLAPLGVRVWTPAERGLSVEVREDAGTFEGNAFKKALALATASTLPCLADDSGLEVDALDGAPGVFSARYAGEGASDEANRAKLLDALQGVPAERRSARFRCALVLVDGQGSVLWRGMGTCEGRILAAPRGDEGFGYDPIFAPQGEERSMAELSPAEKNAISHRGVGIRGLRGWLEQTGR